MPAFGGVPQAGRAPEIAHFRGSKGAHAVAVRHERRSDVATLRDIRACTGLHYSGRVLFAATLLVHLLSFATYLGSGFAQLQIMKLSEGAGIAPDVRDAYERLSATILAKIEVPAIFGSILSGIVFVTQSPLFLKQGWLHGKLTCVLLLAVLSHLEMFNARKIVKARAAGAAGAAEEIAARKKRHATFGGIGALLVAVLLFLVTFVRLGAFAR